MDLDEMDGYYPEYDCTNEPRPDSVVYHEQFAELKQLTNAAIELLLEPLEQSCYHNAVTNGLWQEINGRTQNESSEEVKFAVAGDMAAGKSSVINSILSKGTIARKGDSGGSCTWVVQRFMKQFVNQASPYAARVYFFNTEQARSILRALLKKYYDAAGLDKIDDDDEEEEKDDQVQNYNEKRTALETLTALFCEHEEFETEEKAKAFLKEAKEDQHEESLEQLVDHAEDLLARHLDGQDFVSVNGNTTEELLFNLQRYTFSLDGEDGSLDASPWPLVRVIDFGLDVPLLNEGIIFIDSSGLSDANSTRANNAAHYHQQCTHKISVAEVSRAKDNAALRENLAVGYKARGSGNTILVLTRGDRIDRTAEIAGRPYEKKREHALNEEMKKLNAERKDLNNKKLKTKREDRFEVESDIRAKSAEIREKEKEFDALRICMRNRNVAEALQKQYKDLTGDPKPLAVFVVGNEDYNQHCAGYLADNRPPLDVKQTNIPGLRQCIFLLPAKGKLNDALHLATAQLPSLINSVELYCSKTHMARKGDIEATIMQQKTYVEASAAWMLEMLRDDVHRLILGPLKYEEGCWAREARILCRTWNLDYSKDHLAILKKEGFKKGTKKRPADINWNSELVALQKSLIDDSFGGLYQAFVPQEEELRSRIIGMLDKAKKVIRADPQFNIMALEGFFQSFITEKPIATRRISTAFREIKTAIGSIHERAVTSTNNSFILNAMLPIYEEVKQIKGRGGPQKRQEIFEHEVSKIGGIFTNIHDQIEAAFNEIFNKHLEALRDDLHGVVDNIRHKFLLLCENTEVKDEKEKEQEEKLRQHLQKNVIKARELVEGPIEKLTLECKNYSRDQVLFVPAD